MSCEDLCPEEYVSYWFGKFGEDQQRDCVEQLCEKEGAIPGLIDAEAAVIEAQKGTPQVAFIQTDKYFYEFDCNDGKGEQDIEVVVENTGFQAGRVKMLTENGFALTCKAGDVSCSKIEMGAKPYIQLDLRPGEKGIVVVDPAHCRNARYYFLLLTVETTEGPEKGYVDQTHFFIDSEK